MKAQKFKKGDKVTPIVSKGKWNHVVGSRSSGRIATQQLIQGEIYTVNQHAPYNYNIEGWFVTLDEKEPLDAYDEDCLEKVEELEEQIQELIEEQIAA